MRLTIVLVAGALTLGGCGTGTSALLHSGHSSSISTGGAPAAAVRVIRGWSQALGSGHVAAAAAYFRIPSIIFLGNGPPLHVRSLADAELVNADLPCGARLIATARLGRYVNALFRLSDRPGQGGANGCGSGNGETARTNFLIQDGRIVQWLRAPDQPGDNGTPKNTAPQTTPTSPSTIPGGGTPLA